MEGFFVYMKKYLKVAGLLFISVLIIILVRKGNSLFVSKNAVVGVDISHYQGNVDFDKMERDNIQFVFIKATEGAKYKDDMFEINMDRAEKSNIYIGCYHFFSAKSSGKKQVNNYIKTVGDLTGKLLPVVDVEVYESDDGTYNIVDELKEYINCVEKYYGVKPIIYTTIKNYNKYIKADFEECPLWIRSVYFPANFITKEWTFWQYSDTETKEYYQGEEECIDMNVFDGSLEDLKKLIINNMRNSCR